MLPTAAPPARPSLIPLHALCLAALTASCGAMAVACAPRSDGAAGNRPTNEAPEPPPTAAEIDLGRGLYLQHGCGVCHGLDGSGNGPRAAAIDPPPRDYRDRSAYRRGTDPSSIAETIAVGIATAVGVGGMPAYPHLSEADRLAIARFVVSLLRDPEAASVTSGEPATGADVVAISGSWLRAAPASARMGAGYLTIENRGGTEDAIVGARCDAAETVELHRVIEAGGVMRMEPVERIDLPAGATVRLEPGGLHLMLIGLLEPLAAGRTFSLELELASGATLVLDVPVRAAGEVGR